MKLSEAIMLGAMQGPQLFHKLNDDEGGTCAMGAALLAVNKLYQSHWLHGFIQELVEEFPVLSMKVNCPDCGEPQRYVPDGEFIMIVLWNMIVHLNNDHRWSREKIADWVATIERNHALTAEQSIEQTKEQEVMA